MAGSFEVDSSALRVFAAALDAEVEPAGADATEYVSEHLSMPSIATAVLYNQTITVVHTSRDDLVVVLESLETALRGSATELRLTADAYDQADDATNARLDALHSGPGVSVPPVVLPVPRCHPAAVGALSEPVRRPPSDLTSTILTVNWLSPTEVLMEVLDLIFDFNPLLEAHKGFSGDWNAMYAAGSAVTNLATFHRIVGEQVLSSTSHCMQSWRGDAAMAAASHFSRLAEQCDHIAEELEHFAAQCEFLAQSMETQADLLAGIYASIMDIALAGVLAYAFAVATSWTVVGGVVGFIAGTAAFGRAVWLASQAWEVIQEAQTFVDLFIAAGGVIAGLTATSPVFPLPAAYDNERV